MAFSFLTPDNVVEKYLDAKKYTDQLTEPFPEFDRIARKKPHPGIDKRYPKTTDGTTASIIRKTGKRVVQQLPTGVVTTDADDDWLPIVAQFVYTHKILPFANEEYDLIQKCWTVIEKALTFGACPTYTPFLNHDGYLCTDCTIVHWGNIVVPKGKKSGYAMPYTFMESWWQKEDIEALIDAQGKLGEDVERTWDTGALAEILDSLTTKDDHQKTGAEKDRSTNEDGILLVTGFQKGVKAKFYTFSPAKKLIVRTKANKDPRGKMPIDWMYGDIEGSNPFGRGIIELIGDLQNLIDSDMQMYQFNRALQLAPPIIKRGRFPKSKIVYEPNRIIDIGDDPNADIKPLDIDTTAIANYPQLYGLLKSQILNMVNSPDTSVSADVGNPGFSKTPEGLKQQQATISVDDNFVRKMFEAWFENWSETAINLYFAERQGTEVLQLDDETARKLRKLAEEGSFDLSLLSDTDELIINYDSATPALKFRVDASTSKMKNDSDQLQALTGLLQTLEANPVLQQVIPQEKLIGAWNAIVAASGVEDPEELSINIEEFKQQQALAQQQAMAAQANMTPPSMPQTQAPQPAADPVDSQIADHLRQLGLSDQTISGAIDMLNQGHSSDAVLQSLGVGNA